MAARSRSTSRRPARSWQPTLGKWRQTWVDDSGNYLAFTRETEAGTVQMRIDSWASSTLMLAIDYARRR